MRRFSHTAARLAALCVILVGGLAQTRAQDVTLKAWTDSTFYQIGRWITLRVDGEMPATIDSLVPVVFDTLGPFEVLARKAMDPTIERDVKKQTWMFRLVNFDAGEAIVPSVPFAYQLPGDSLWRIARSQPLPLTITTVQVDTAGDIRDVAPPLDAPWMLEDVLPYLLFFWALAVIGALAFLYVYYRKKRASDTVPAFVAPALPAHEAAIGALRELEDRHLWQSGKVKQYYSEVTEIIRLYFERRYRVRALEMTTDEVLEGIKRVHVAEPVRSAVSKLLITADLVKFAKYGPTPDENVEELTRAYSIVRNTAPKETVQQSQTREAVHVR